MAWHYLRAAVFQRLRLPLLGDVPVNLAALGAFAVMGLDNPVFWAVGGGMETAWLALSAGRAGYRRKIDAARRREAWRKIEERRLALYNQLPPAARQRHHTLRAACQALLTGSGSGFGTALKDDPESTAELFTWLHLKLLLAREATAAGQPGTTGSGAGKTTDFTAAAAADADLPRLQAHALLDLPDPATARLAEHSLSLLENRRLREADAAQRLEHIDQHLAAIEAEIANARQRLTRDRTPYDFRHSVALARDRLEEDLAALPPSRPVAEVDTLLSTLTPPANE